ARAAAQGRPRQGQGAGAAPAGARRRRHPGERAPARRGRRPDPLRGAPRPAEQRVRALRLRPDVSRHRRRDGAPMTDPAAPAARGFPTRRIDTPDDLRLATGADFTFSDQQFAAITAPLTPAVVIAGAGSGKTAVMAARVAYLVLTGQVRPDEVLGLTFTTKATA